MDDTRRRFELQVLPHLDAAYRFARWLADSPSDADDVVQEAILRAFRGYDALRGSDVNCHLTAAKQKQRRNFVPLPDEHDAEDGPALIATTPDPESASIGHDEQRTLNRLLAAMPEEQREILVLREIEEMGYREIAAVVNVPIGTVMSRLARARATLRSRWLQDSVGELHAMR